MERGGAPRSPAHHRTLLAALALAVLAILPFQIAGGLDSFIMFDDDVTVFNNPHVLRGLGPEGIRWACTSFEYSNWLPLTRISHLADISLFGLDARAHHLVNVLLHAAATALLFLALARLGGAFMPSALVAALFAVHPLHVESVAWISERKDLLSAVFFALVLLAWERYVRRRRAGRYLLVVLLLALGLMAKPMLVTVPLLLLLLDWWPLGRRHGSAPEPWRRLLREKLPLLALALASGAVTLFAQRSGGAVSAFESYSLFQRSVNAVVSYALYLFKTLWPSPLAVYYPLRASHPAGMSAAALALLAALSTLVFSQHRRRPWLAAGWAWFLGMLLPVIGIIQIGGQALADRYTYLPLTGLFIMIVWTAADLPGARRHPLVPAAGACIVIALLAALTARQTRLWQDSSSLFAHTLAVTRDNWFIRNNFGDVLREQGKFEEAVSNYREALRLRPRDAGGYNNLSLALAGLRKFDEAELQLREALRLEPNVPEFHYNLGLLLDVQGRLPEATAAYREALRLRPDYAGALFNLKEILRREGQRD